MIKEKTVLQPSGKKHWIKWIGVVAGFALICSFMIDFLSPEHSTANYFSASVNGGRITLEKEEPHYYTEEELYAMAEDIMEELGTAITDYSYAMNYQSKFETRGKVYEITAQSEVAEIRILGNGQVSISFNHSVSLPKEYCFNNVSFYGDEDGLSMIRYGDVRKASEYMGSYLVISEDEARKRLEASQYFSIYSEMDALGGDFSDENIELVELMYLVGSNCKYYQPYYCFYVECESFTAGISNYSLFFVPALMEEDLEKFPEEYPLAQ